MSKYERMIIELIRDAYYDSAEIDHPEVQQIITPYKELEKETKTIRKELEKYKACVNECLAIIAHVDPATYNNREAIDMIIKEILNTRRDCEAILKE